MEVLVLTTMELEQNTHLVLLLFHKGLDDFENQNALRYEICLQEECSFCCTP